MASPGASGDVPAARLQDGDRIVLVSRDRPDRAVVLGPTPSVDRLGDRLESVPHRLVGELVHAAGLAANTVGAASIATGDWVQLTAESAAKLAELGPSLDANGVAMGVLRGDSGQMAHVLRFESLGAAPVAAASLVGGMAVQLALLRIERALEDVRARVDLLIEGSQIEVEARLVAAIAVLDRIERRVQDRGVPDGDDWTSLAAIEVPVADASHQTVRWLDPLRDFLEGDASGLGTEVRALRENLGIRDVGFWLRMHAHAELATIRWQRLYLMREAHIAPERLGREAATVLDQTRERHRELRHLHELIADYLGASGESHHWLDQVRLISRSRLRRLRGELAAAVNAYAAALDEVGVSPADAEVPVTGLDDGLLVDVAVLSASARRSAGRALGAGADSARDVGAWIGASTRSLGDRLGALRRD